MTRNLRHAALVAVLVTSAFGSVSASRTAREELNAPYVAISSLVGRLPNIDPLVDPHPFFLVDPWQTTVPMTTTVAQRGGERTLDLPLEIQAMNVSGTIFLTASCVGCQGSPFDLSVIPNQISVGESTHPALAEGSEAVSRFAESVLSLDGGGASIRIPTASAVLRVATRPSSPVAGSFLVLVQACPRSYCAPGTSVGAGYFVVSQVVIPADGTSGDCPNVVSSSWRQGDEDPPGYQKPDALPLQQFLRGLFTVKRTSPEQRSFTAGVYAPVHNMGWDMLVEKPPGPPIDPTESVVRLVNPTGQLRSLVAVGSNCRITGNVVLNPGDPPRELRISRTNTRTIVLTGDGEALGRFSDANFWTLFGGRKVTLSAVN